jgi:hypothetical protein
MGSMQCSVEDGYQPSVYSKVRKTVENIYQVSIKFRCTTRKFNATSKKTPRRHHTDQPLNSVSVNY